MDSYKLIPPFTQVRWTEELPPPPPKQDIVFWGWDFPLPTDRIHWLAAAVHRLINESFSACPFVDPSNALCWTRRATHRSKYGWSLLNWEKFGPYVPSLRICEPQNKLWQQWEVRAKKGEACFRTPLPSWDHGSVRFLGSPTPGSQEGERSGEL